MSPLDGIKSQATSLILWDKTPDLNFDRSITDLLPGPGKPKAKGKPANPARLPTIDWTNGIGAAKPYKGPIPKLGARVGEFTVNVPGLPRPVHVTNGTIEEVHTTSSGTTVKIAGDDGHLYEGKAGGPYNRADPAPSGLEPFNPFGPNAAKPEPFFPGNGRMQLTPRFEGYDQPNKFKLM